MNGPWHAGEIALQATLGAVERMDEIGRKVIRDYMPDQHRDFFAQLPFAVFGNVDAEGRPWATLRAGEEGFMHSPDPQHLQLLLPAQLDDPAQAGLRDGAAVGMLGIELHTRRRNRLNGRLRALGGEQFEIAVAESFGNCPKYIHQRDYRFERAPGEPSGLPPRRLPQLDALARDLIGRTGTFLSQRIPAKARKCGSTSRIAAVRPGLSRSAAQEACWCQTMKGTASLRLSVTYC